MRIGPIEFQWVGFKPSQGKLSKSEKKLADDGRYIDAIKAYRERTSSSLRDAKDVVDKYRGI